MNDARRSRDCEVFTAQPQHSFLQSTNMKPSQFFFVLFVTVMLESICAIGFDWQPEAAVELPANGAIHPPNALRRMQSTTELSDTEAAGSVSATDNLAASASSSTTETEAPTTIMVLLPDNLAPSYSGSGSVMFFDGSVGDDDKKVSKSAGSDSAADEASGAASERNFRVATVLTAFTILSTLVLA
ncbi:hypothetical protein PR002_g9996 [Phytophthora rubi]|uniref:Uncharacterized protein n=1 Tax=Phytophthora rubi TaxID=129364 RepID=A0A6A3MPS9_9STRA|nr:hypothetical protein PR002_g9996 [Phytophthora rubi]